MTFAQWASANPDKVLVILSTILAAVIGTLGNLLADNVDGNKYPRLFQFGKACQAFGIALPKLGERLLALYQGTKPTDTPKPPSADGKTLALGLCLLVGGIATSACGHGAKACAVVDIAAESCRVVRYLAPDGTTEELSAEDLADLAKAKKTARERAAKAVP